MQLQFNFEKIEIFYKYILINVSNVVEIFLNC